MSSSEPEYCAYCGKIIGKGEGKTRDHVFPENLYPVSNRLTYSPITVAACKSCNESWSADEELFRDVVNSAGDFNSAAEELYLDKIKRSLGRPAGNLRLRDLLSISEAVEVDGVTRLKIYPARDARVLAIIRKIVIG